MDGAAKPWRVLVLLSLSVCSCATNNNYQPASDAALNTAATADIATADPMEPALIEDMPAEVSAGTIAENQELLHVSAGQFGISRNSAASYDQFLVSPVVGGVKPRVSKLTMPPRLVVDLMGAEGRLNRVIESSDSAYVNRIRVGAYPDKSRLVFDLKEGVEVSHDVKVDNGQVLITVAALNSQPPITPDVIKAQSAEIKSKEPVTLASTGESYKSRLTGLRIESVGNENVLIAEMDAASPFVLEKTAPSEYVLKLHNAGVDPEVARTILSPANSGAIRSARPTGDAGSVAVRIFAAPSTVLQAKASESRIIVKALEANDKDYAEEVRAQAAPAEGKPPAEEAATGAAVTDSAGEAVTASDIDEVSETDLESALLEEQQYTGRLISLDLQDTDIDNALRIIAEVSNLNIIASDDVTGKVTLRLIDVPWDQALDVILKTNGLDKVREGNVIRIAPVEKLRQEREALIQNEQAKQNLEPLRVRYIRVSYARASDMKPLVESVLTERGSVTYDERTNQIIIKDIPLGLRNVAQLVKKLDLRTPQVLLETQIVEAKRSMSRELGAELGYHNIQSPEFGTATGNNFPNEIVTSGSIDGASNTLSSFPAAVSSTAGSAISFLFKSADGAESLALRLTALEQEGRVRVVSRPAVATTNNKPAIIKSVEKLRVKTPSGGLSVATGQGATAGGSSAVATEVIEIGITLEVTPQASPDYYVLLDIDAKSSTLGSTFVDGIPSEIERSATSTVLVSSGQTFAMGGIYKISDSDSLDGIPFFKDVPFLGHLFRRSKVLNSDEELIFFVTPRIIEGSFDDAAMKVTS